MKQTKRMLTSTLLFSSCFYYANYSQRVTCTHTQFLTCKFVFTESWFTSLSLCSNTLSNFQDSSTELLPVISIHTLQVSPLFLHNQLKKFSNSEQIYLLPWNYLCPQREGQDAFPAFPGAPSTSGYVCTLMFTLPQRLFPALQSTCDGEEHVQQIYNKFELLLRTVICWPPCCHKGKCSQHSDKRGKSQVP